MRQKIKEIRKSHPAVPNWLTLEQKKEIKLHIKTKTYERYAKQRVSYDHIVPLNGETVWTTYLEPTANTKKKTLVSQTSGSLVVCISTTKCRIIKKTLLTRGNIWV